MTIVEFLLDRLADEERLATAAVAESSPDWVHGLLRSGTPGNYRGITADLVCIPAQNANGVADSPSVLRTEGRSEAVVDHVIQHDPARVLADVAAKRQIIGKLATANDDSDCTECNEADYLAADILRALAAPYASHPEYDSAWSVA